MVVQIGKKKKKKRPMKRLFPFELKLLYREQNAEQKTLRCSTRMRPHEEEPQLPPEDEEAAECLKSGFLKARSRQQKQNMFPLIPTSGSHFIYFFIYLCRGSKSKKRWSPPHPPVA